MSHSSHALPAPKPRPTNAGHARRLKRRTEKTTPNETPRPERMSIEERQRSHCHRVLATLSKIDPVSLICVLYRMERASESREGMMPRHHTRQRLRPCPKVSVSSRIFANGSSRGCFGSSTFSLSSASLIGRVVREMDATGWGLFSAMAAVISSAIDGCNGALGVLRVIGSGSTWC